MSSPSPVHLTAAIRGIWQRSRATVEAQVREIEQAVGSFRLGDLHEDRRAAAERAAHKLAGSAGIFGFPNASEIAFKLEKLLKAPRPADAETLAELALSLRAQLLDATENTAAAPATVQSQQEPGGSVGEGERAAGPGDEGLVHRLPRS